MQQDKCVTVPKSPMQASQESRYRMWEGSLWLLLLLLHMYKGACDEGQMSL
jgi:hypothetical protein